RSGRAAPRRARGARTPAGAGPRPGRGRRRPVRGPGRGRSARRRLVDAAHAVDGHVLDEQLVVEQGGVLGGRVARGVVGGGGGRLGAHGAPFARGRAGAPVVIRATARTIMAPSAERKGHGGDDPG